VELKRRAVKLYVEDGYAPEVVAEELGIGRSTLAAWAKRYREQGEEGLRPRPPGGGRAQASAAAKQKAVELKRENPALGSRRISQLLRRLFFLKAGPETVRQALQEQKLIRRAPRRARRNPAKPRFFERTTPNQLWQADIFSFRLGGRSAYLIGYVDDYSRYVTGLGLFRSQTAEHVLEVYRRAVAEYGVPREMLTDNGRQYTNWRGKTRFEQELAKERVRHLRSQPHHPQTLGKIERLWKTIWVEFLSRAQFERFEEAEERVRLWVAYYNHKRPHQGIGGLCPADRFFEIQHQLRQTLEAGVAENVLEQALRGKPRAPFYLVGRLGEQSVVIRAEKGKVRMLLDGAAAEESKELVYPMEGADGSDRADRDAGGPSAVGPQPVAAPCVEPPVEGSGAAAGGDDPAGAGRAALGDGSGAGAGDQPQDLLQVGTAGPEGAGGGALRAELGPSGFALRWGEGEPEEEGGADGAGAAAPGAGPATPQPVEG